MDSKKASAPAPPSSAKSGYYGTISTSTSSSSTIVDIPPPSFIHASSSSSSTSSSYNNVNSNTNALEKAVTNPFGDDQQYTPDGAAPPSFEEAVAAGTAATSPAYANAADPEAQTMMPLPGYFDISIVPTENILYRKKGVASDDEILQANPDELYKFFFTHLTERPELIVEVKGTHEETTTHCDTTTNKDGSTSHSTRTETHTIVDFEMKLDASHHVSPDWSHLWGALFPDTEDEPGQWRTALEEFTLSQNPLKEIHLNKEIPWDYATLRLAITSAVRAAGYHHTVTVNFTKRNHKELLGLGALGISCLWIIALPVFFLMRKRVGDRIVAHFPVMVDGNTFYRRNVLTIMAGVSGRVKHSKVVAA
ncbi:hypothetical protein BC829DRAFT_440702 [Chytridium lagenaria]|nr:hypothetical protein BC829DRAFT_440702 [Chytridium lagenaria]